MRKFTFKKPEATNSTNANNKTPETIITNGESSTLKNSIPFNLNNNPENVKEIESNYVLKKNEILVAKSIIPFSVVNKKKSPINKNFRNNNDSSEKPFLSKKTSPTKSSQTGKTKQTNLSEFIKKSENVHFKQPVFKSSNINSDDCETKLKEFCKKTEDDDDNDFLFIQQKTKPTNQSTQIPIDISQITHQQKNDKIKSLNLHKLQISPGDSNEKSNSSPVKRPMANVKPVVQEKLKKTPPKSEPTLVACLTHIESGAKSPLINKNETYEMKLLGSLSSEKINKKQFNFVKNNEEPLKAKVIEEKRETLTSVFKLKNEAATKLELNQLSKTNFTNLDDEKCKSCQTIYSKGKFGDNRKVFDTCMHPICFSCMCKSRPCVICKENEFDINDLDLDSVIDATVNKDTSYSETIDQNSCLDSSALNVNNSDNHSPILTSKKSRFNNHDLVNGNQIDNKENFETTATTTPKTTTDNKNHKIDDDKRITYVDLENDIIDLSDTENDSSQSSDESIEIQNETSFSKVKAPIVCLNNSDTESVDFEVIDQLEQSATKKNVTAKCVPDKNVTNEVITNSDIPNEEIQPEIPEEERFHFVTTLKSDLSAVQIKIPKVEYYEKNQWIFTDIKDCSGYYHKLDYKHSERMFKAFSNDFGLKSFRPQQFGAINAALEGENVFVLMPTGGGKSLIYQLPAVLDEGVTFVVSPLKSLIIDQVDKLNTLNIRAAHLLGEGSDLSDNDSNTSDVYRELTKQNPSLKLVYVTPEKLNASQRFQQIIGNLYSRNMLSRLVIDEAHCVSAWGHDFRKDYTQMGKLRDRLFPNVPVMLLTATATPRVRKDILVQMNLKCDYGMNSTLASGGCGAFVTKPSGISSWENKLANRNYTFSSRSGSQDCAFFIQSFNRENLKYAVKLKQNMNTALEEITILIKSKEYADKSGIVYCISRNECESVSAYLQANNIKAQAYHAGMKDTVRAKIQNDWSNTDKCRVVCATIAFGMGIDKADVRYVIHLGLPKSVEGYYQESGRAGRDGLKSYCLLYYNNADRQKWLSLMKREQKESRGSYEVFQTHVDNLYRMAAYCDNRLDCRRTQILEYFGQKFDRKKCIGSKMKTECDNCNFLNKSKGGQKVDDIREIAIKICQGVNSLSERDNITLLHLTEILKGSKNAKIIEKGHDKIIIHNLLSNCKKNDVERIIRKLVYSNFLKEDVQIIQSTDTVASYIKIGPKFHELINPNNKTKILFDYDGSQKSSKYNDLFGDEDNIEIQTDSQKLLNQCRFDLEQLIKKIGSETNAKNIHNLFKPTLITEMLNVLPTEKFEILQIDSYTLPIFEKYQGEEFLKIFKSYKGRIKQAEREDDERLKLKTKAEQAAKAAKISNNDKTYGLIDDKWITKAPNAGNSSTRSFNGKRKSSGSKFAKRSFKKARTNNSTFNAAKKYKK